MKALCSLWLIVTLAVNAVVRPPAPDPTPEAPNEGSALQYDADNQIYHFKWWGHSGRTYFLQSSQDLMQPWNWVPVIETGEDAIKEWAFTSTADMFFVRLRYTDRPTYDPINEDFDGDGVSNILEVQQGSDPFDYYSQPAGVITPLLSLVSGDNQSTTVDQYTAQPVVLLVTNTASTPLVSAPVTVNAGVNAFISSSSDSATITNSLVLRTNTQGQAIAYLWFQGEPGSRTINYQPEGHATPVGTISAQVLAAAPIAPSNVTTTRTYTDDVQLTWNDNSSNETGFTLYRSDDNGATWTVVATLAANTTTYTVAASNAANLTTLFRAQASNSNGSSASSNQSSNVPPKPAPRYAVIDLGSDHTHVMKIANSGHVLARGNGTSIAGWRWYNDEWSSLTHSEENGSAIDMNNSGTVLGSCAKTGKGWKDTSWSVSIKAATWAANSTTAALSPSATGSAYYNDVLVSEGGAPQDPVDIRQPFGIDDNGAVYSCDVSGNDPYADPPPSSVFTDYAYTLGSEAQSVHKTVPYGWDLPIRIGPVCTAGCVQSTEPDYEYTYDGATLDFTPIDINNDGAVVGDTSLFHGGSTETLPATALAINNRHYPPGDTGASDWQIISDTTLIEKKRNDDGSPGATYKSIPITDLIDRASTQTYSGFHLADINDQGAIVATAQKAGATHAVLLVPVEIVKETEQGSGKYQELKAPPIYQPDDGIGAGQVSVTTYDVFNVQFGGTNLTNTAIDTLTVSFSNSSGSFSGLLTETSASSGVFSSSNGAFSVTLNPVTTTTSTTTRTLSASLTASAFGLTDSQRTIQETAVGSGSFVQPQMDCLLTLSAELNSSSPDVISCRIEKGLSYQLTLTETGNDTKVFQTTSGDFTITISNYSNGSNTLNVTISSTYFSGSFSYQLTQMGGGGLVFSNSTTTATNMTPDNPVQTHHGVFYIKIPGTASKTITLKTDGGDTGNPTEPVEVTLSPSNDLPGYLLSPPLLMVGTAQSAVQNSYTGLTTLQMASFNDKLVMAKYGTTDANYTKASAQPFYLGMALPKSDQTDVPPWHYSRLDEAATSMGYAPTKRVDHLVHSDLMSNLKNYSVLYLFCHGDARATPISEDVNFQGIWLWTKGSLWDSLTHKVTAAELAAGNGDHKYNLVFMNACGSANTGSGVAQGYANALHAKNYVGWEFPANTTSAGGAAEQFFRQLKGGHTVSDASKDVTATANFGSGSGGSGTAMNLSFVISDDSVIIDQTPPKAPTP